MTVAGMDLTRMTHSTVVVTHVHPEQAWETEGPWLIVHKGIRDPGVLPVLVVPASAVVAFEECQGECGTSG